MRFQRINRSDPEKVFVVAKNAYTTAALTAGQVVVWNYNGTDDGLAVTRPATAKLALIAGVVGTQGIAISGYGEIQVYGHNSDCLVTTEGATAIAVGDKLKAQDALFSVKRFTGDTVVAGESGVIVAGEVAASDTTAARVRKVFVRCM